MYQRKIPKDFHPQIREEYLAGKVTQAGLAARYKVSQAAINQILKQDAEQGLVSTAIKVNFRNGGSLSLFYRFLREDISLSELDFLTKVDKLVQDFRQDQAAREACNEQ